MTIKISYDYNTDTFSCEECSEEWFLDYMVYTNFPQDYALWTYCGY